MQKGGQRDGNTREHQAHSGGQRRDPDINTVTAQAGELIQIRSDETSMTELADRDQRQLAAGGDRIEQP